MIHLHTRTSDTVELVSVADSAVDRASIAAMSEEDRKRVAAYQLGETHDASVVPLLPGAVPSSFTVRPLNPREYAVAEWEGSGNVAGIAYAMVRLGLVDAQDVGDWKPVRRQWHGANALTLESVSELPDSVVFFLANHIMHLSRPSPLV